MKLLKLYAVIILAVLSVSLYGQTANRLLIDQQLQQSVFPYSTIVTDVSNNMQFVVPGAEGTHFTIVGGVPTWTAAGAFTDNIYTADGSLTGNRDVALATFDLGFTNGNIVIGATTGAARLHVQGAGNTNATIGLLIQDSDTDDLYSFMDNGELRIGNATTAERPVIYPYLGTNEENINLTGLGLAFFSSANTSSSTAFWFGGEDLNADPGTQFNVFLDRTYNPNNSPAGFINLDIHTTINQTGTSNGRVRGIYIESTQTSAADYRALETEEGDVVFNGSIAYTKVTTPSQIILNQDDYSPTNWEIGHAFRLSTDASRDITGFSKTNVRDWEIREIWNVGSFDIVLKHQDSGSGINKRIICPGGVDATVTHYARLVYDGTSNDWRLLTFN